ncbi:glutamate receptor 3.7-like [Rutidosis leptorrhynchoides]|uniref:glutamate receptor 3.7-like n=1 Tax=Rutidosis leptorrhynchoides TaxID=125765 RepID=UPI003A9A404E
MKLRALLFAFSLSLLGGVVLCKTPSIVNIGAIFTFDSVIGRVAKAAIELAISDVNKDSTILHGTKLRLMMEDSNCSVFLGSVHAFRLVEEKVVAIVGPQSSSIARTLSEISNGLKLPLISYAATDPTLSSLQFPFFIRATHSDSHQMAAIVDLIDFYGWKEVIAVYVDDDHGRNGVFALDEKLTNKMFKVSHKLPLPPDFDQNTVMGLLNRSKIIGPRVYVVHLNPDPRLRIFVAAKKLQMMTSNYVWFATDWFSTTLDSFSPMNQSLLSLVDGVVGIRQHIPATVKKRDFLSRWRRIQKQGLTSSELNIYGYYAYDSVWAIAYSIDKFIRENNSFSFSLLNIVSKKHDGISKELKVFDGGDDLRRILLETNFTGLTGQVNFNQCRKNIFYNVINLYGNATHTVGYWSSSSGLSVLSPENQKGKQSSYSVLNQSLHKVKWPGGKTEKPRGWVIGDDERPLIIGVPYRASFVEFVTQENSSHAIKGYCIDVFLEARKLVPYDIPYIFKPFGDGQSNPSYNQLVSMVADDEFDAAVGDIAIVTNRTRMVDFTQPFAATGLVIIAPLKNTKSNAWVFLKPFETGMWCATASAFVMIGLVIWILEHRVNDDFRGPPKRQLITIFLFTFSTLFKKNQEAPISPLGRLVMIVWLFLLMVITSSYTANLTSILTVEQLSSPITGIESLISNNWPIGYQVGSFAYSYLSENLGIHESRLKSLRSPEEYEKALRLGPNNRGGVAAIVDELLYIDLFLKYQTEFGIIGQPFTKNGWGFAFKRGSPLAIDMSTAILKLSESRKLEEINNKWFCGASCRGIMKLETNQLHIYSFWGLYLLSGGFALLALLLFLIRSVRQYVRYKKKQIITNASSVSSSNTRCSQVIFNFFDFVDEKEEAIKKLFKQSENSQTQASTSN